MKRTSRTFAIAALSMAAMIVTATLAPVSFARTAAGAPAPVAAHVAAAAPAEPGLPQAGLDPSGTQTMGGGLGTAASPSAHRTLAAGAVNSKGGNMFDACAAPSLATMQAWLASPYRAVGIYIGGVSRSCAQPNLTPQWINATSAIGWGHVPIYVGLQASCATYKKGGKTILFPNRMSTNEATAATQGAQAASDAIAQMRALGIGSNVPIYLDVEAYNTSNGPCSVGVRAFTQGWTKALHANGYLSGVYGSASSMIRHIQAWTSAGNYVAPDNVWFARWNGKADAEEPELPAGAWEGRRIHQFLGGHFETYGGVTINIDSNYIQNLETTPSTVTTLTPRIVWDSKTANVGTKPVPVAMAGKGGIPTNASAVVLNVQIANPTGNGDLIVEPYRGSTNLATQQFQKGQYVSITVVVPVSQKVVQFRTTAAKTRLIASAVGYLSNTGTDGVEAVSPHILWDSKTTLIGQKPVALGVRGTSGVPDDATAVILNVQVVKPSASGQLVIEPHQEHTNVGMQQLTKGRSISATVVVPLHDPAIQFRLSRGEARVIVSVLGYLSPTAQGRMTATSPTLIFDSRSATVTTSPKGFAVAGRNGIPDNATAALISVEVVNPAAAGQLIVEPYGYRSNSGIQQFIKGQSISTMVLVPLKNKVAQLRISAGKARVIITSVGYVTPETAPQPIDPGGDDGF